MVSSSLNNFTVQPGVRNPAQWQFLNQRSILEYLRSCLFKKKKTQNTSPVQNLFGHD
jgi:hypothetical protein